MDDDDDDIPEFVTPESWRLAFTLDAVALRHGWRAIQRQTSQDMVTVTYRKDPLIALVDSLPGEDQ